MQKLTMVKVELLDHYIKCLNGIQVYKAEIEKTQENEQVEDKKQTELVEEKVVGKRQSKKKNG